MTDNSHLYAVVLAGGGGTRLWPKSRQETPKQFLRLYGQKSMLELTVERLTTWLPLDRLIIVTNQQYAQEVRRLLPQLKTEQIIAEPAKRDTALAMLVGTLYARTLDPEAVIINAAADHIVTDVAEYERIMKAAALEAQAEAVLVTVGITPTYPATGFGYIRVGTELKRLGRGLSAFRVENFTEKPNQATAGAFLATKQYFWNANMYVWKAKSLLDAFQRYQPETMSLVQPLLSASVTSFTTQLATIYEQAPTISIDYAISEQAENLVLIPADFGWHDIGEWKVVYELAEHDEAENALLTDEDEKSPPPLLMRSHRNLVMTNGRKLVLLGVNDFLVIDTDQALLIAPLAESQNVKKVVEALKASAETEFL